MLKRLLSVALLCASMSSYGQNYHFDNKNYVEGEFLVRIVDGKNARDLLLNAPAGMNLKVDKLLSKPMNIYQLSFNDEFVTHREFQEWLYGQSSVLVADYNYHVYVRALPNDASFTQQWHHVNTGQTGGTADADIDSDLAWDITTGGTTANGHDIVVCMVEGSGGNLNHQDLSPNRWINTAEIPNNGIDDDNNGYVDDYEGWNTGANNDDTGTGSHGTNCLGMIGAKGNNGLNVAGANWDVKLMVVNMGGGLTQANVIEAYTYPLTLRQRWNQTNGAEGAFVVATSASWGIDGANPNNYPLWCDFYNTLGQAGIINIGATTNSNLNVDTAGDMPTACSSPYMVGVGRTDHNDNTAGGYGVTTIELGAPGINVVTTNGTTGITTTTGTSFACPLTAGVVGLAYSIPCTDFMSFVMADPQGAADAVLQAMLSGVDPKAQLTNKFVTGGRLNAKNTLDNLMASTCTGTPCFGPSGSNVTSTNDTQATITFTPNAGSSSSILEYQEDGATTWTTVSNATSPYTLSGLNPCTTYNFRLSSVCSTDTSANTSPVTFTTTGCGNCIDLAYCTSAASDGQDEFIESFTVGTYTNTSGNDGGYGDFTGQATTQLEQGQTYAVSIEPGFGGQAYDEYSRVWIDFDQSGDFQATELVFDQGAASQTTATGTISVPATAAIGETRMRVVLAYQGPGQTTLPAVCAGFTYGETEDYCIEIIAEQGTGNVSLSETQTNSFAVYPNPATNEIHVILETGIAADIQLVDARGTVVGTTKSVAGKATIDISNLAKGIYSVVVTNEQGVSLKRISKM